MKLYKYLYYRLYVLHHKIWKGKESPEWSAMVVVSIIMYMNLLNILSLLELFHIYRFPDYENLTVYTIIFMIFLMFFNYKRLIANNNTTRICQTFKSTSRVKTILIDIFLFLFVVLSAYGIIALAVLLQDSTA